jgi:hypothetical protein
MNYPGQAPNQSWKIGANGMVRWLSEDEPIETKERYQMLAIGSNRRPGRLAEHLGDLVNQEAIGVRVQLKGLDLVYPAHIADYGVITVTAVPSQATIESWLLFLTETQLLRLLGKEELGTKRLLYRLSGVSGKSPHLREAIQAPLAILSSQGALPFNDGRPRRLARIRATSRELRQASLNQAHQRAGRLLNKDLTWPLTTKEQIQCEQEIASFGIMHGWPGQEPLNNGPIINLANLR